MTYMFFASLCKSLFTNVVCIHGAMQCIALRAMSVAEEELVSVCTYTARLNEECLQWVGG